LRRRGFLQAGLVMTGGVVLGLWPSFQEGAESPEMAALRRSLLHYAPEKTPELPNVATLQQLIHAARVDLQESRYSPVLGSLPLLLTQARLTVHELNSEQRIGAYRLLAQTYRLIFNVQRKLGDPHLATIAADRGMQAAQDSGDAALVADLAGCVCVVLSDAHHHRQAIEVCTGNASDLEAQAVRRGDPASLSVYGQLLLSGAEAAAQSGDRALSDDFYREADAVARLLGGDANHSFTAFGPTNITVHRIHAAIVLGEGERAVRLAKQVDCTRLPVLERKAHHLMDVAIAFGLVEKPELAITTLLAAERTAQEEVQLDQRARALVGELVRRNRKQSSELNALARRMLTNNDP